MTEQQDVLDPRRQRRRTPIILLGILTASVATVALVAGGTLVTPEIKATPEHSAAAAHVVVKPALIPTVTAPGSVASAKAAVQTITVTVPKAAPKAKPAVAKPAMAKASTVKKSTKKSTSTKKVSKKSGKTVKQYCANPNPVKASGSTGKAFLSAVNKERAKLGIRPLKWSSSLASTATSWSKSMLKKDMKTGTLIDGLAHNPNRPGSENVAVVYSSAGYSGSTAVAKMHKNLVRSNGHCMNLMNPKHSTMGAGVASSSDGNTWYATQNFR